MLDTTHPARELADALGTYAATCGRFADLSYTHPGEGRFSTARIADGARVYASARGRTPAAACANLARRVGVSQ